RFYPAPPAVCARPTPKNSPWTGGVRGRRRILSARDAAAASHAATLGRAFMSLAHTRGPFPRSRKRGQPALNHKLMGAPASMIRSAAVIAGRVLRWVVDASPLEGNSPGARAIGALFTQTLLICAVIFVVVAGLVVLCIVRFRARPGHEPAQREG